MGAPGIKAVTFLANNGVRVVYSSENAVRARYEPPNGSVSLQEAAVLLGTYPFLMYRLKDSGRVRVRRKDRRLMVPVRECHRLRKAWRGISPTTRV
jgi:hypothetical protein